MKNASKKCKKPQKQVIELVLLSSCMWSMKQYFRSLKAIVKFT